MTSGWFCRHTTTHWMIVLAKCPKYRIFLSRIMFDLSTDAAVLVEASNSCWFPLELAHVEVDGVTTRQSKAGTLSTSVISFAIIIHPYVMMMMMMMMMMTDSIWSYSPSRWMGNLFARPIAHKVRAAHSIATHTGPGTYLSTRLQSLGKMEKQELPDNDKMW